MSLQHLPTFVRHQGRGRQGRRQLSDQNPAARGYHIQSSQPPPFSADNSTEIRGERVSHVEQLIVFYLRLILGVPVQFCPYLSSSRGYLTITTIESGGGSYSLTFQMDAWHRICKGLHRRANSNAGSSMSRGADLHPPPTADAPFNSAKPDTRRWTTCTTPRWS
jgi:hypothetical protein